MVYYTRVIMNNIKQYIQEKLILNKTIKKNSHKLLNDEEFFLKYELDNLTDPMIDKNMLIFKANNKIGKIIKEKIFNLYNSDNKFDQQEKFTKDVENFCKTTFNWSNEIIIDIFASGEHRGGISHITISDENEYTDLSKFIYTHQDNIMKIECTDDDMYKEIQKWMINIIDYIISKDE